MLDLKKDEDDSSIPMTIIRLAVCLVRRITPTLAIETGRLFPLHRFRRICSRAVASESAHRYEKERYEYC